MLFIKSRILDEIKSTLIGKKSPELKLSGFLDKELPTNSDLITKNYKLVNFWASWCAPCRAEHHSLLRITNLGFNIIGINYKDHSKNAETFLKELGDPYYKIGSDKNGEVAIAWGVYGIPETFLIDSENRVVLKIAGPITKSIYEDKLQKYLNP